MDNSTEHALRHILEAIGEDPNREGLKNTPRRVVDSWLEIFGGYKMDPEKIFTTFKDPCDELVVLRDIEFFSTCEHHMQPFFGRAHIGYLPTGRVVGISKLARLLEIYARRLQIQERIGQQVTEALMKYLEPSGCGVILEGKHLCICSRGVQKQNSIMVTSSMVGTFRNDSAVRSEFLRMVGK